MGETCETTCDTSAECTDPLCRACYDSGIGEKECNDCCLIKTEGLCNATSPCQWEYSGIAGHDECRNEAGVDCSGIPEVPAKNKSWLIVGFAFVGLVLAGALRFKKRKAL